MIKLFSNSCPKCKVLKMKLKSKNINYEEITDIDLMISMNLNSMPQLEVDGKVMNYLESVNWIKEQ